MRLTFHYDCEKLIFDRISWNRSTNQIRLASLWSRSKILSYQVKLVFSVFGRVFIVCAWFLAVQPLLNKFESLSTCESHQNWESSTWLTQMHIQSFRKISSLVSLRLSFCDPSPPLKLIVGGSSKVNKKCYTHPNSIPSVSMSSMSQKEEMGKNPFWYFWTNRLWPFNFESEIFKFKYLGFCSSDWETKDSSRNIEIERRHGEKPILIFWLFHLLKSLWLFNFP